MRIQVPEDVKYIIEKLNNAGYEAYAVGGCVRDSILGRTPDDWDITTSAKPEEIKELFPKTIDTGIQHGTVTVMRNHIGYEVTTYRIDGEYKDNRHPDKVTFSDKLEYDLERRVMSVSVEKDKKGDTWIISRKKDGFTKQINVTYQEIVMLHYQLGRILKKRI